MDVYKKSMRRNMGCVGVMVVIIVYVTLAFERDKPLQTFGAVAVLFALTALLGFLTRKVDMSGGAIKFVGNTDKVSGVIGYRSLFTCLGFFLILLATLIQVNPFIFLAVHVAVVCAVICAIYCHYRSQVRVFQKPPEGRMEIWNQQMAKGKFKDREEWYYHYLAICYSEIGDNEQALTHTIHAISHGEARGAPDQNLMDMLKANQAALLIELDRWQEAAEILECLEAKEYADRLRAIVLASQARLALQQQDIATARILIDEACTLHPLKVATGQSWLLLFQAELALAEANLDEAMKKAEEVLASSSFPRHLRRAERVREACNEIEK